MMDTFLDYEDLINYHIPICSLIEIDRGRYKHWALYNGHGQCYHVTDGDGADFPSAHLTSQVSGHASNHVTSQASGYVSGHVASQTFAYASKYSSCSGSRLKVNVLREDLGKIMDKSKARINDLVDEAKNQGLKARPIRQIINELENQVCNKVQLEYEVLKTNCEYYVTLWKYGVGFTMQAEKGKKLIDDICTGIAIGGGTAIAAIALYKLFTNSDKEEENKSSSH